MNKLMRVMLVIAAAACTIAPGIANAQAYPIKPVRMIVPIVAGSGADLFARLIAPKLRETLGQPIIIENRSGASGVPGTEAVARSAPDGYNILFATTSHMISVVFLLKTVPYDPVKDFTPIGPVIEPVELLVMRPAVPVNSFRELIDYAKRNPGKLTYGGSSLGSYFHLLSQSLNSAAGMDVVYVSYKGVAEAMGDLIGGRVDLTYATVPRIQSLLAAGKLKLLAVCGSMRYPGLPEVPTMVEVLPGFEKPPSWFAFWGPAAMPQNIVARLNGEIVRASNTPEVRNWLQTNGIMVAATSPEQLAAMQKSGTEVFRKVVKAVGVEPQ
jgi:tripartite-type tricarboxylate transporter receptor subunit TctC